MSENYYQISWLDTAIKNFMKEKCKTGIINGNMTIHDFIKLWAYKELNDLYID